MKFNTDTKENFLIVEVTGDILYNNWKELVDYVTNLVNKGNSRILLSWENVNYFDSSAMGALVCLLKLIKNDPCGHLVLFTPAEEHLNIFRQAYFHSIVEIVDNMDSGVEKFNIVHEPVTANL